MNAYMHSMTTLLVLQEHKILIQSISPIPPQTILARLMGSPKLCGHGMESIDNGTDI